jgi:hypothetical protein
MPIHDWTRVEAGIFHDFHLEWISRLKGALNDGILPADYYALAEQQTAGLTPDVLTLRGLRPGEDDAEDGPEPAGGAGLKTARPRARIIAEAESAAYRRKQRLVAIRHVSGDDVVALIEIVSPGNKDSHRAFQLLLDKVAWLLERGIHQLILDLQPPTPRDPRGLHAALWEEITGQVVEPPADKPLTVASYEHADGYRAYVEPLAVGDPLPDMPLFLKPGAYVEVPLEATYRAAFEAVPRRWRSVLEAT